jgi:probable phosphoglycerate mutase
MRAMETARLLGLNPTPEPRLIEMNWGEWEGQSLGKLRAKLGEEMVANEARGLDFRPPSGESPRDVQERLRPLLAALDQPTIAVTHRGVLRALYALATGWDMREKAPHKLAQGCAHAFAVDRSGALSVEQLNIPLRSIQ